MAEKLFSVTTQGHNCNQELSDLKNEPYRHRHGDVARCSCGQYFLWTSTQRDSYWKQATRAMVIESIRNANPTLSDEDIFRILNPTETSQDGVFHHQCEEEGCENTIPFDDEPKCYKHSPDSGSSVRGYSARAKTQAAKE